MKPRKRRMPQDGQPGEHLSADIALLHSGLDAPLMCARRDNVSDSSVIPFRYSLHIPSGLCRFIDITGRRSIDVCDKTSTLDSLAKRLAICRSSFRRGHYCRKKRNKNNARINRRWLEYGRLQPIGYFDYRADLSRITGSHLKCFHVRILSSFLCDFCY